MNLNLKPDDLTAPPTYEWPSTAADFARLTMMADPTVEWMTTEGEKNPLSKNQKSIGSMIKFRNDPKPILFGEEGLSGTKVVFNDWQQVARIKVGEHGKYRDGDIGRRFYFFDAKGAQLADWHYDGATIPSCLDVPFPAVASSWPGKEVVIPAGFEICGHRIWTDDKGYITWLDIKVWRRPSIN